MIPKNHNCSNDASFFKKNLSTLPVIALMRIYNLILSLSFIYVCSTGVVFRVLTDIC
jgi:hypothetical protein